MSLLLPSANTIKKLGNTGIGIDDIGYKVYLFHQLEPLIVGHKIPETGVNSGIYYIAGNVVDFINGYDYFWVNGRKMSDDNIFTVDSVTYDSVNLRTIVTITESDYKVNYQDIGFNICGRIDVTNKIKNLDTVEHQLFEDGSLSNAVASTFSLDINDEDKLFYNRTARTGYFYPKDVITEILSIQAQSDYAPLHDIYSTYIKVRNLSKYYLGSDFVNGHIELISGNAAGSKAVVTYANGYNLNVLGFYAPNYLNTNKQHLNIAVGDEIRVFKNDIFWCRLDFWLRSELDEKVSSFCGKIDTSDIGVNDKERYITVKAYNTVKDLFNKNIANLEIDSGMNLTRLTEIKTLMIDKPIIKSAKSIVKSEIQNNPLSSITVKQVAFDVSVGWHVLDFHPYGNLFKFDLGRYFQVIDEGSFEKSTKQVFLVSNDDSKMFNNYAKIPAHDGIFYGNVLDKDLSVPPGSPVNGDTYIVASGATGAWTGYEGYLMRWISNAWINSWVPVKPIFGCRVYIADESDDYFYDGDVWTNNTDYVNNLLLERNWHGKWCSIEIATEDVSQLSSINSNNFASGNNFWKKLSGLPAYPFRILFHVNENREIDIQTNFTYSYDNGALTIPNYIFDFIQEYDITNNVALRDLTYALGFGCKSEMKDIVPPNYHSSGYQSLRCFSHYKFDGVMAYFREEGYDTSRPLTYSHLSSSYLSGLQLRFSTGNGFSSAINPIYTGGGITTRIDDSSFTLLINSLDRTWNENYTKIAGMKIIGLSGDNFMVERIIDTVAQSATYLDRLVLTLKSAFPNITAVGDIFTIVNKNFNLKVYDFGHSFKDDYAPDVSAISIESNGTYRDLKYKDWLRYAMTFFNPSPLDKIYIGHRNKFNCVSLVFDLKNIDNDDFQNVGWYLKENDFLVEYYDGLNWRVAKNVSVLPTTVMGIKDNGSYNEDGDDTVKYLIRFDNNDWHTGGYDHTLWTNASVTAAPSSIDEDKVYVIRVTILNELSPIILKTDLSKTDDLGLCITWDGIEKWASNLVNIKDGKVVVDTLSIEDVSLPMFGIELYQDYYQSYDMIRQIRPVTKLKGSNADSLFAVFDYNNIEANIENDMIISDPNKLNGISHLPKNINFHYLMDEILNVGGFKQNKRNLTFMDNYNQVDRNSVNLIGTGYDGHYHTGTGWDAALINENMVDYFVQPNDDEYCDICVLRDDGIYRLWAVVKNKDEVHLYESNDLKTWTYKDSIVSNIGTRKILALSVVKNTNDDRYGYFITMKSTGNYELHYYQSLYPDDIDASATSTLLADASYHFGKADALQMEGKISDTSPTARLLAVVKYSGMNLDGDNNPTDTPNIYIYYQNDVAVTDTWTFITNKDGYKNPVFIKGNYSIVDGSFSDNKFINQFTFICADINDKLYRCGVAFNSSMLSSWYDPILIKSDAVNITGFYVVKNALVYNLKDTAGDSAFTIVPSNQDVFLFCGIQNYNFIGFVVNHTLTDWSNVQFWRNKLIEMNEMDWWRSNQSNVVIDGIGGTMYKYKSHKLYLGFRKPFNKVDCFPFTKSHIYSLQLKYWNGKSWNIVDKIYQFNSLREDGEFHTDSGFHFETPFDWISDKFENVISGYTTDALDQNIQSLYWVEISIVNNTDVVYLKRMINCYTSLFLTKGRNVYLMEDWKYVKNIYTYAHEMDKNIKVDSITFDKEEKLALVHIVEDNPYEYKFVETLVFDYFGNFKCTYPIWVSKDDSGVNQHITMKDTPQSIYRRGSEHIITSGGDAFKSMLIGCWDENFIEEIYKAGTHTPAGKNCVGINFPIPSKQMLRKYTIRGQNWLIDSSFWDKTIINNLLIGKRNNITDVPDESIINNACLKTLISSLTNSGLIYEELINKPYVLVTPGYYAAIEKSFIDWSYIYDWSIIDMIDTASLPASGTIVNDAYVLTDGTYKDYIVWWDGLIWNYKLPYQGIVIYNSTVGNYRVWDGKLWYLLPIMDIWPGRTAAIEDDDYGAGIEFTMGQQGIKIPYFRPYNIRPDAYLNNNVNPEFDYKVAHMYRHINLSIDQKVVFGHDFFNAPNPMTFGFNIKPTCGVLLPDLTAMKDEVGPDANKDIQECNAPGIAFGCYEFKDRDYDSSSYPTRGASGATAIYPMANMGICMYKPYGKVQNWKKAFFYNGSYNDVTDYMNYRDLTNYNDVTSANYICMCSDVKFFALTYQKNDDATSNLKVQYFNTVGAWVDLPTEFINMMTDLNSSVINKDTWAFKTTGKIFGWNPFISDWCKKTINGESGYWIRIIKTGSYYHRMSWINMSGVVLFDSSRWYYDYGIGGLGILRSDKIPVSSFSNSDCSFFDTYVPICLEYDVDKNRITGCFWNYLQGVNEYYPFVIQFNRSNLKGTTYNPWDWKIEYIKIIDSAGRDYSKKIQSIANVSVIDNKALIVDDANPEGTAQIANIKNFTTGDSWFTEGIN